jgi:hypothetical protein
VVGVELVRKVVKRCLVVHAAVVEVTHVLGGVDATADEEVTQPGEAGRTV